MASKPNINTDSIFRQRVDETGEILIDMRVDGEPVDVTGRKFAFEFLEPTQNSTIVSALLVPNESLLRFEAKPQRFGLHLSNRQRGVLALDEYKLWVHEFNDRGYLKSLVSYSFKWLGTAESWLSGVPLEPAVLVLDYITADETFNSTQIYEGPKGDKGDPGEDATLKVVETYEDMLLIAAPTPKLIYIEEVGKEMCVIKHGSLLFGVTLVKLSTT